MNIGEVYEYIKAGLPKPSLVEVATWLVGVIGGLVVIEDYVIKKKSLGNWIWTGIRKFFTAPWAVQKSNEEIKVALKQLQAEVSQVKAEVTYNGGKSLKDVVSLSSHTIRELALEFRMSDEFELGLRFRLYGDGGMHSANKSFLSHFGFTESDVYGRNWENWVHPIDRDSIADNLAFAIKQRADFRCDFKMRSTINVYYNCSVWAIPLVDKDRLLSFIGKIDIIKN